MIAFSVSELGLAFGQHRIFENLSFSVNEGERVGVIGVNGAGKTSLFRCLIGEYTPTEGAVYVAKDKTIGLLAQNTDLSHLCGTTLFDFLLEAFPELLAIETEIERCEEALSKGEGDMTQLSSILSDLHTTYAHGGGLEYRSRCHSMLIRMGFPRETHEQDVATLSGGQHTRLSLARLLAREPDILLLDEPTNHLDIDALTWLEEYLSSYRKTLCIISHDRYFLDRVTQKTLHISLGGGKLYPAPYSRAREMEEADAASQERRYREQQKEIARIRANIDFQRRCGQEHNFVTIRSKEKQLEHMERVERVAPPPKNIRLRFALEEQSATRVIEGRGLSFSYGTTPIIRNLNFLIRKGECVLFLGANGCGKSTLMKLITGELSPTNGVLELGYNIKVGYYDQENRGLTGSNTVLEELHHAHPSLTKTELHSTLALFLFDEEDVTKLVSSLSGGERARLSLAKLILKKVNLLVLDEPTNHLDIGSREALETALGAFGGTIVAVSHDRYFISRLATRIIELDATHETGYYDYALESYDDAYEAYMMLREHRQQTISATHAPSPSSQKARYEEQKRQQALERNAQKRKERAKKRAEEIEAEIAQIEEELWGDAASDYVRAQALQERKDALEEELLTLYEEIL